MIAITTRIPRRLKEREAFAINFASNTELRNYRDAGNFRVAPCELISSSQGSRLFLWPVDTVSSRNLNFWWLTLATYHHFFAQHWLCIPWGRTDRPWAMRCPSLFLSQDFRKARLFWTKEFWQFGLLWPTVRPKDNCSSKCYMDLNLHFVCHTSAKTQPFSTMVTRLCTGCITRYRTPFCRWTGNFHFLSDPVHSFSDYATSSGNGNTYGIKADARTSHSGTNILVSMKAWPLAKINQRFSSQNY